MNEALQNRGQIYPLLIVSQLLCSKNQKSCKPLRIKAYSVVYWHPRRESNSQFTLRRGGLYPFNYGGMTYIIILQMDIFFSSFYKLNARFIVSITSLAVKLNSFCRYSWLPTCPKRSSTPIR